MTNPNAKLNPKLLIIIIAFIIVIGAGYGAIQYLGGKLSETPIAEPSTSDGGLVTSNDFKLCQNNSDCKIIYNSCDCEATNVNDPSTSLGNEARTLCSVNNCTRDGIKAACIDNKCQLRNEKIITLEGVALCSTGYADYRECGVRFFSDNYNKYYNYTLRNLSQEKLRLLAGKDVSVSGTLITGENREKDSHIGGIIDVIDITEIKKDIKRSFIITVISPNGGEIWKTGENHTISWNSKIAPNNSYVKLYLKRWFDDAYYSELIQNNLPPSGTYSWLLPQNQKLCGACRISAQLMKKSKGGKEEVLAGDASNNFFTITNEHE